MKEKWKRFRNPVFVIPMILGGLAVAVLAAFFFGLIVMLLWNWLMPDIFGISEISYWQAWGLVILAHILFKADGERNHRHHSDDRWKTHMRDRMGGHHIHWTDETLEKDPDSNENGEV